MVQTQLRGYALVVLVGILLGHMLQILTIKSCSSQSSSFLFTTSITSHLILITPSYPFFHCLSVIYPVKTSPGFITFISSSSSPIIHYLLFFSLLSFIPSFLTYQAT
ncbi:hypothetical protein TWF132_005228 [Orbilia oligospora]|nr:hypothetical protein TWF132_005228 [Orbilia oligospora]